MQNNSYSELRTCIENESRSSLMDIYNETIINTEEGLCCEALDSFQRCLNNFTTSLDFCNDGKKNKAFELMEKVEPLVCKDKGKALRGIWNAKQCIKEKAQIEECIWPELMLLLKLVSMSNFLYPTRDYFDLNECSRLEKLETCVIGKLDQCSDETSSYSPSKTAKEIFAVIKNVTSCEHKDFYDVFKI
ncbi:hypothetical protein HCN44_000910 [Aphidius gifuensis]|uniref:Uncharacterized protein n=2 Tax=Aphidius gifuensis TaxID=684658 RepID=A0A835CLK9_APHGI|nr:hypothetical protein HCN44_000910 [Aphidius gifuensis]